MWVLGILYDLWIVFPSVLPFSYGETGFCLLLRVQFPRLFPTMSYETKNTC
jgi:hypothetical protein